MCSIDYKKTLFCALLEDPCCLFCACSVTGQMTWKRTTERLLRRSLFRSKCVWLVLGDRLLGAHSDPRERVFSTTSTNGQEGALTWIRVQKWKMLLQISNESPRDRGYPCRTLTFNYRLSSYDVPIHLPLCYSPNTTPLSLPLKPHKRNSLSFA